jgi:dTDP-4-amino-4,6-dideoxy-D-galactose acyltransferase
MSIILLEWDTKFFNKKIGRLNIGSESIFNYLNQLNDFDIVYVFSNFEISIDALLMDIKVTYSKSVENVPTKNEIVLFDIDKHDYDQLLELAYLSGFDSRFLKDSSFGEIEFKRLYKQWIDNSINDKDTLVLISQNDKSIEGFVTVKKYHTYAQIGLIAVNPSIQGKGIGGNLIHAVENHLKISFKLIVATQETNVGACKFYENLGFTLENKEYIYHYYV